MNFFNREYILNDDVFNGVRLWSSYALDFGWEGKMKNFPRKVSDVVSTDYGGGVLEKQGFAPPNCNIPKKKKIAIFQRKKCSFHSVMHFIYY